MKTKEIAFFLARFTMGINLLAHGLVRFPKLDVFRDWMVEHFQDSLLPDWAVSSWGTVLPYIEFAIGALLILGLFTRPAIIAGSVLMIVLIFGSCIRENWEWVDSQMLYALFFFFLLIYSEHNCGAVDNLFCKKKEAVE